MENNNTHNNEPFVCHYKEVTKEMSMNEEKSDLQHSYLKERFDDMKADANETKKDIKDMNKKFDTLREDVSNLLVKVEENYHNNVKKDIKEAVKENLRDMFFTFLRWFGITGGAIGLGALVKHWFGGVGSGGG